MQAKNHFKTLLLILLFHFTITVSAQNKCFCIGSNHCGLNLGNPLNSRGLKLNLFDKNINNLYGVNLALSCSTENTIGVSLGLISVDSKNYDGVAIGGFFVGSESRFNGIGIAGLSVCADTMNGVFFSIYGNTKWNHTLIKEINGIAVGGITGV